MAANVTAELSKSFVRNIAYHHTRKLPLKPNSKWVGVVWRQIAVIDFALNGASNDSIYMESCAIDNYYLMCHTTPTHFWHRSESTGAATYYHIRLGSWHFQLLLELQDYDFANECG